MCFVYILVDLVELNVTTFMVAAAYYINMVASVLKCYNR